MAATAYPYSVRDSSNTTTDNRKTGLTPAVSAGKTLAASPAAVLANTVTVVEIAAGDYIAIYDAEVNGDASFPIDWGSSLSNPNDRYGTLILTRDAGRVIAGFNSSGQVTPIAAESNVLRTGTAQAGTTTTITLDSGASATDGSYVGHSLILISGTGSTSARQVTAYNGTTKVATVNRAWGTAPNNTTVFVIRRQLVPLIDANTSAVDTAGTTTLLGRLTGTRAGYLDNLTNLGTSIVLPAGTVKASPSPSAAGFTATLAGAGSSASLVGQIALFQSGALAGQERTILTDTISGSDHTLTFVVAFGATPAAGDTLVIG